MVPSLLLSRRICVSPFCRSSGRKSTTVQSLRNRRRSSSRQSGPRADGEVSIFCCPLCQRNTSKRTVLALGDLLDCTKELTSCGMVIGCSSRWAWRRWRRPAHGVVLGDVDGAEDRIANLVDDAVVVRLTRLGRLVVRQVSMKGLAVGGDGRITWDRARQTRLGIVGPRLRRLPVRRRPRRRLRGRGRAMSSPSAGKPLRALRVDGTGRGAGERRGA